MLTFNINSKKKKKIKHSAGINNGWFNNTEAPVCFQIQYF
jgi:hypothetical protein